MRRAVLPVLVLVVAACHKPPKTTVDVDTMREASFVQDIKEDPNAQKPPEKKTDDTPVPAANATTPMPASTGKSNLPEPEIMSSKIDKDKEKDPPKGKPQGGDRVTKAECSRMFDRFFDLTVETDERFAGLGPDGKAMVRQIAAQDQRFLALQKDCEADVSRAKYNCAMAAKTSAAWQTCMK